MISSKHDLLLIGASAGGPAALASILSKLPADFPVPIVLAQHVDTVFVPTLARWLSDQCALPVSVAVEGDSLQAGRVWLADSKKHLILKAGHRLSYVAHPEDSSFHPSIDLLFESAAKFAAPGVVAVLLTGMGRDGARGLLALRKAGAITIAQDESSCAVYGMPKAAAETKAAGEILSLDSIPGRLVSIFQWNGKK